MTKIEIHPYGIDHDTWDEPTNFNYDTAEGAANGIVSAYGLKSGHIVVRRDFVALGRARVTVEEHVEKSVVMRLKPALDVRNATKPTEYEETP